MKYSGEWNGAREHFKSNYSPFTQILSAWGCFEITSGLSTWDDSEWSVSTPNLSARITPASPGAGDNSESGYFTQKFGVSSEILKKKFQNVAGPRTHWTELHSYPQVMGACHLNLARFSSILRVYVHVEIGPWPSIHNHRQ